MISTVEKAARLIIMLLIDQRFCITPPYSTTRPGMLINPTSVAAVICHAVSPGFSHDGAARGMHLLREVADARRLRSIAAEPEAQVDSRQPRGRRNHEP